MLCTNEEAVEKGNGWGKISGEGGALRTRFESEASCYCVFPSG